MFGIASFVLLVSSGALSTALIAAPFTYQDPTWSIGATEEVSAEFMSVGPWVVDTPPEAVAVAFGGVIFLVVSLNALNGLARLAATATAGLLIVIIVSPYRGDRRKARGRTGKQSQ